MVFSEMPRPLEKGLWPRVPPSYPSQQYQPNGGFSPETRRLASSSHVQLILTPRGASPAPYHFLADAGRWRVTPWGLLL